MKPIIGISCEVGGKPRLACQLNLEYVDCVIAAGGIPLILPPLEKELARTIELVDGILFSGGDDYDPELYNQRRHKSLRLSHPRRSRADLLLARRALKSELPILGICGGLQILNIALGGDLIQDIKSLVPGALQHRAESGKKPAGHAIRITPGTLLSSLAGKLAVAVNSYHHQAAGRLGRGLRVSAVSGDGVIEAFEAKTPRGGRFFLAIQWHPERDPDWLSRVIFKRFVEASCRYAGRRARCRAT